MDEITEMEERGKEIIRKEGINFTVFKQRASAIIEGKLPDEDSWVQLYNDYASCRAVTKVVETVEEFLKDDLQDCTIRDHGYQLKKL